MKNLKPSRHQGNREKDVELKSYFPERNDVGLNEKNGEDEMRFLYREMEDWYREEEKHSAVKLG